jgi:hypothetical protein
MSKRFNKQLATELAKDQDRREGTQFVEHSTRPVVWAAPHSNGDRE